jgi:hypothetical protein
MRIVLAPLFSDAAGTTMCPLTNSNADAPLASSALT